MIIKEVTVVSKPRKRLKMIKSERPPIPKLKLTWKMKPKNWAFEAGRFDTKYVKIGRKLRKLWSF